MAFEKITIRKPHYLKRTNDIQHTIKACLRGDPRAQQSLYQQYVKAMYHLAVRMVSDRMEAEDVVQEAFIKVFKNLHQFKGESTIGAWIKKITINIALNKLQKQQKVQWVEEDAIPEQPPETEQPQPAWKVSDIHAAIKALPAGSRVVVTLHLLEGYQHQEIAQILNISTSTSKSQYARGKKLLQQLLKKNKIRAYANF